jgi:hypothetical protein
MFGEYFESIPHCSMKKAFLYILKTLLGLTILYVLSYTFLSLGGGYEPSTVEYGGTLGYTWAPFGFYEKSNGGRWNIPIIYTFYPLWCLDASYVHKPR